MNIEKMEIPVRDIVAGYRDNNEEGVVGYGGNLNIRPPYQREFVYSNKQELAVIDTVKRGFPLNVMYWSRNDDGTFEVLDGQQRTLSLCHYVNGDFMHGGMYFHNLTKDEQDAILDYKCDIYVCVGGDRERLEWFRTINIAGEKLTEQELLNANYTGEWLANAKRLFSKNGCWAVKLGGDYIKGAPIRQEVLEQVLDWISGGDIQTYMAEHQHDTDANELKSYFSSVIGWVERTFPVYRKEMKGVDWGRLYNEYGGREYSFTDADVSALMEDEDVTKKKGVYEYLLSGRTKEKCLSLRTFSDKDKREVYEAQGGVCPVCGQWHAYEDMEGDHIVAWSKGGHTTKDNLQMLCKDCNLKKAAR